MLYGSLRVYLVSSEYTIISELFVDNDDFVFIRKKSSQILKNML